MKIFSICIVIHGGTCGILSSVMFGNAIAAPRLLRLSEAGTCCEEGS